MPPPQEAAAPDWARPSPIPPLAAIIARREDIFTKQRTFHDRASLSLSCCARSRRADLTSSPTFPPPLTLPLALSAELQRKSQELIATKLTTYARTGSYSTFGYKIGSYCAFCRAVDVPPWPASPPVFALFAHQVSYYATSSRDVLVTTFNMVHKVCRDLWDPLPGFKELLEWPGAQAAVLEWKKQARASSRSLLFVLPPSRRWLTPCSEQRTRPQMTRPLAELEEQVQPRARATRTARHDVHHRCVRFLLSYLLHGTS